VREGYAKALRQEGDAAARGRRFEFAHRPFLALVAGSGRAGLHERRLAGRPGNRAVTGGEDVTRQQQPRLYNLLENLCISRGIPMPKLKVMDSDARNAFATGLNRRQYAVTVTTGLLNALNDQEIEAVLGHELTHIRNGDVRMMVIAVIIAGVVSFFAELVFRLWFYNGFSFRSRSDDRRGGGGGAAVAILVAVALIAVAYFLSIVIRLALSRSREFLADAGKTYLAEVTFGISTDSDDVDGRLVTIASTKGLDKSSIDAALNGFRGELLQVPPRFAAVRVGGRRLYELARQGEAVWRFRSVWMLHWPRSRV